jgi:hypothetical protein
MARVAVEVHNYALRYFVRMKPIVKKVGIGLLAAGLIALVYPTEQTVAPEWQVTVVDEKGSRLAGIHVRETWRQQSIEQTANEDVKQTDANGMVHFTRRVHTASLLRRILGCWDEMRKGNKQSNCGPHASIWAFGPGLGTMDEEDVRDVNAKYRPREIAPDLSILPDVIVEEQNSMILLHHCPSGKFGPGCKMTEAK